MHKTLKKHIICLAPALLIAAMPIGSAHAFDDSQKEEIGAIVREYLLANPELIIEVQEELQRRDEAKAIEERKAAIASMSSDLFENPNDPVLGTPNGSVTVVEFFDYNCGFCKRAMADMQAVIEADPDVKFVLKEFPILGEASNEAHQVAIAFNKIAADKYAAFHIAMMESSARADRARALEVAAGLGVTEAQIDAQIEKDDGGAEVNLTYQLADALGLTGTPSYVIGDQFIPGALGVDALRQQIEEAR